MELAAGRSLEAAPCVGDAGRQANIMPAVTPDSFIPDDRPIRHAKPIVDAARQ